MHSPTSRRPTRSQLLAELSALRESLETYQALLDESSDPIFSFYPDGTYRYVNKAFADGVGRRLEDIIGHAIWDVFSKDEADKRYAVVKWVFANAQQREIEVRVPRPDGDRYYLTTAKPVLDEQGQVKSVICISKEISERKRMEEELRRLSTVDTLTGLFNRNYFEMEARRIFETQPFPVSIVMIDMNNLKQINDSLGHAAGDDLLHRTAEALRSTFRHGDLIARFGGDEFIVLLPETGESAVQAILQRLRMEIEGQPGPALDLSVGHATGREGSRLAQLIRTADDRMYAQKSARKQQKPD